MTTLACFDPVNSSYPKNKAFSSVPASMLNVLPRLPADVWYRFLGSRLDPATTRGPMSILEPH